MGLLFAFDRENRLELLTGYHVLKNSARFRFKVKDDEGRTEYCVLRAEGQHPESDVRSPGQLNEMDELVIHHPLVPDPTGKDRLVQHHGEFRRRLANKHLLALHPDPDEPLDQSGRYWLDQSIISNNMSCISWSLQ